jgi:hypothetical protein
MRILTRLGLAPLLGILLGIVAVACQGGNGLTAQDSARAISDDELAVMVLPLGDFGAEFASFEAGEENGFMTAERRADNSIDPQNETADLKEFGWQAGYEELYFDSAASGGGSTLWFVSSGVDLFETAQGAAGYFEDSRAEVENDVVETKEGMLLDAAEIFDADIADEAEGVHFHVAAQDNPGSQYWASAVVFRRGRLIASVGIFSFDEKRAQDTLRQLAGNLNERISRVLTSNTP